jgi:hypothetical protein
MLPCLLIINGGRICLDLQKMVGTWNVALRVIKRKGNFSFNDLLLFNNLEISDVLSGLRRRIFSCLRTGKDEL